MKKEIFKLFLVSFLGTTLASPAATLTFNLGTTEVDDGALDEATETWTQSVTNFNGTDASFDLVVTAVASGGNWNTDAGGGMAITGGALDTRVDAAGENAAFSVGIVNFNAGTSGYNVSNVDFGFADLVLDGSIGTTDSGTFALLNGSAPTSTLTWTDMNAGSDFTGHPGTDDSFDLQLINDTFGTGTRLTSFSHNHPGGNNNAWRYDNIQVEFVFVPEPSSTALLGLATMIFFLRKRNHP